MLAAKEKARRGYLQEQKFVEGYYPATRRESFPYPAPKRIHVSRENLFLCGLILLLILVSAGLIAQYGRVVAANFQVQQVRREISRLQEERDHLFLEVRRLSSLERIEAIALNELGLQYPDQKQWLLLSAGVN